MTRWKRQTMERVGSSNPDAVSSVTTFGLGVGVGVGVGVGLHQHKKQDAEILNVVRCRRITSPTGSMIVWKTY